MKKITKLALAASAVGMSLGLPVVADSGSWLPTTGGAWNVDANWTAPFPNGAGQTATINVDFPAASDITLESNITVGQLSVADSTTAFFGVTLSPGASPTNTLTFDSGAVGVSAVFRKAASATNNNVASIITAPVVLNSDLAVTASQGTSAGVLRLHGPISGVGGIRATGTATGVAASAPLGTVIIGAAGVKAVNSYTGPTILENGNLQFTGDAISGVDGALGNSTTPIVVGTPSSNGNNSSSLTLQVNTAGPTGTNLISRDLDYSGVNSLGTGAGTGGMLLRYTSDSNLASGVRNNKLTVAGTLTLSNNRNTQIIANRAGMTIEFTGNITGGATTVEGVGGRSLRLGGFPANATTSGFTELGGAAVYRFSDVTRDLALSNLFVVNGLLVIAGTVPDGTSNSPIGRNATAAAGINFGDGSGSSILDVAGAGSIRGLFLETPGASFNRDANPGGASNIFDVDYGATGSPTLNAGGVNVANSYRFGGLNTTGEVSYLRGIFPQQVNVGGTTPLFTLGHNIALTAETGGVVNFVGAFSQGGTPSVVGAATTTTSNTRLTINGVRNHPQLDTNGDGIPNAGLQAGLNANEMLYTTGGTVRLSNTLQGGYINAGTTEVMGGTLIINGNLSSPTVGDSVIVNAGATIGGFGNIRVGKVGSLLDISGTLNPADPLITRPSTASLLTSDKPVVFRTGSTFAVDLNSGTVFPEDANAPRYDRLALGATSSLVIEPGANLNVGVGFEPAVLTFLEIVTQAETNPAIVGTFAGAANLGTIHKAYIDTVTPDNSAPVDLQVFYNGGANGRNISFVARSPVSTYALPGSGTWTQNASWTNLSAVPYFPKSANATALFGSSIDTASAVTLDSAVTVRVVRFDSPNSYTVQGAGAITLAGAPLIDVVSGQHTISVPVTFASTGNIAVAAGSQLTVEGGVAVAAGTLATAVAGTLNVLAATNDLGAVTGSGTLDVFGGTVNATALNLGTLVVGDGAVVTLLAGSPTASLSGLTLEPVSTLDLKNNDLVLEYSEASPISDVISALINANLLANGDVDGLPTTLAISEAGDLGITDFGGLTVDETAVLVKYTYVGDANLDGQVDALDYERVDLAIGNSGVFGTAQGDLNYDGNVDALDYEQIDLNIGNGVGSPLAGVFIPEPTSLSVLAVGGGLMARRRRVS